MSRTAAFIAILSTLFASACELGGQRTAEATSTGANLAFASAALVEAPSDTLPTVVRRIWGEADFWISPSPDGRFVSLTDWETGDVAVRDLETGDVRHVTHNPRPWDPGFAFRPLVSPDGARIVYSWWTNGQAGTELRIVDWTGGEPRLLHHDTGQMMLYGWAADSRSVLALRATEGASVNEIVRVAVPDGSLTVLDTPAAAPLHAAVSPDARFLAYDAPSQENAERRDLFVLNLANGERTRILDGASDDYLLAWTPDGRYILLSSDRTGTPGVWLLPVGDGRAAGEPQLALPDAWGVLPVGFVNGDRYFYDVQTGAFDLYVATLAPDHGSVVVPPARATPRRLGQISYPDWSPDGRQIAYIRTLGFPPGSGGGNLLIRTVETGEIRELSLGQDLGVLPRTTPRWAPDGRSLVLTARGSTDASFGAYRVDAQTGQTELLLAIEPAWDSGDPIDLSSDGRFLYYRSSGDSDSPYPVVLLRKDLGDGSTRELFRAEEGLIRNIALSPDGSQLALSLQAVGPSGLGHQLAVVPAGGGDARELTPPGPGIPSIAWAPDGRSILLARHGDESLATPNTGLWRVSVAGGEPEPLGLEMVGMQHVRMHPDGRRIAFTAGELSAELWVMEGFLPAARD